jgi:Transposase DDE domain
MTAVLYDLIRRSALPLAAVETHFAADSSGFSTSRFVRWFDEKYGVTRSGHDWVKVRIVTGVKTNIIAAAFVGDRDAADCPQFRPLLDQTAQAFTVREVSADKAYLSVENVEGVAALGGQVRREEFLKHYHQRSNVELFFKEVKSELGLSNYRVRDFDEAEGWVQVCLVAFCYLEYYRLRQRAQAPNSEWWFRQRAKGLATQVRLDIEAADLEHIAKQLETEPGRRRLQERLRKAVPLEQRRPA